MAVDHHIPLITNLQIAQIMLQCLIDFKGKTPESILIMARVYAETCAPSAAIREAVVMENVLYGNDIISMQDLSLKNNSLDFINRSTD